MKYDAVKKICLGSYPTSLDELKNLNAELGRRIYIKRDDTTGPAFGGNKTRKLEYILQDALDQSCTAVLTVGGPQTNHGRTTAAAARKLGLKPILVLGGNEPELLSGNLVLDAMMGTDIVFDGGDQQRAIAKTIARYEAAGEKVYTVPMGGSDTLGFLGYFTAVQELMQQMEGMPKKPTKLICAAGSLGTFSGLYAGARYFGAPFEVIGIPVFPDVDGLIQDAVKLINAASVRYRLGFTVTKAEINIQAGPEDAPYYGAGYDVPDTLTRAAIFRLARAEGIILDPTYTGKAFRGLLHLLDTGYFAPHEDVIFLHTGGAVAVWSKQHLDAMQQELYAQSRVSTFDGKGEKLHE